MHYAAHNLRADLRRGSHGFLNTWAVSRFETRAERDAFVERFANNNAQPVSRKDAERIWRGNYLSVGEPIPRGGLFNPDAYYGDHTNFWNELNLG